MYRLLQEAGFGLLVKASKNEPQWHALTAKEQPQNFLTPLSQRLFFQYLFRMICSLENDSGLAKNDFPGGRG